MIEAVLEAVQLDRFMASHGWRYYFIGGLAVQHWGEPRVTRDIDLSLLTGFGGEDTYIDALLSAYAPRFPGAREFARKSRVLLLLSPKGIGIDISLAALPYEELALSRAVPVEMLPGETLRLCSPEDFIIMKVFAGREIDMHDARSVVVRQGSGNLDWRYIEHHLTELGDLKEDFRLLDRLRRLRESAEPPPNLSL